MTHCTYLTELSLEPDHGARTWFLFVGDDDLFTLRLHVVNKQLQGITDPLAPVVGGSFCL